MGRMHTSGHSALSPRPGLALGFPSRPAAAPPRSVQHCRKILPDHRGSYVSGAEGVCGGPHKSCLTAATSHPSLPGGKVWWALRLQQVHFWSQTICPPCRGGWKELLETVSVPREIFHKSRGDTSGVLSAGAASTAGMMPSSIHRPSRSDELAEQETEAPGLWACPGLTPRFCVLHLVTSFKQLESLPPAHFIRSCKLW